MEVERSVDLNKNSCTTKILKSLTSHQIVVQSQEEQKLELLVMVLTKKVLVIKLSDLLHLK